MSTAQIDKPAPTLGLWTGVGVNIGTMIGVGVFISAGFMATGMGPAQILLSWLVGGALAMAGARAYAAVAAVVPRSGGEYRYLSDLIHPSLGYLAGWTSLLAGFAAPVASNAVIAGPFAQTLVPGLDAKVVGIGMVVLVTAMHAFDLTLSKWSQDVLAMVKVVLIAGFIAVGLAVGSHSVPHWTPPQTPADPTANFMANLVWVMYAYSGWNAAVYAAEEFKDPKRTVPRSMVIGVFAVMGIYLLVNWVLVANLTPKTLDAFLGSDRAKITLGHLVTQDLLGKIGGDVMSVLVVLALFSGMSSMAMVGPRVYDAMARDGYLPRMFASHGDKPPMLSVLLQGAVSVVLVATYTADKLVSNIGVILTLMSMATVLTLFKVHWFHRDKRDDVPAIAHLAAVVFLAGMGWMVFAAVKRQPSVLLWSAGIAVIAMVSYGATRVLQGKHAGR